MSAETPIDDFAPVRAHLQAARKREGLTQEALAEKAGVEVQYVADMESRRRSVTIPGTRKSPDDWAKFRAVAVALGEDAETILRACGLLGV